MFFHKQNYTKGIFSVENSLGIQDWESVSKGLEAGNSYGDVHCERGVFIC